MLLEIEISVKYALYTCVKELDTFDALTYSNARTLAVPIFVFEYAVELCTLTPPTIALAPTKCISYTSKVLRVGAPFTPFT